MNIEIQFKIPLTIFFGLKETYRILSNSYLSRIGPFDEQISFDISYFHSYDSNPTHYLTR